MRHAIALAAALTVTSSYATTAHALSLDVPRLRMPVLDASLAALSPSSLALEASASDLFLSTTTVAVPPRYAWVLDDARPFWYAAGASAVVALGTHVLVGLPALVFSSFVLSPLAISAPAAFLPVLIGAGSVYLLAQSALAAGAAAFAFSSTSDIYEGDYLAAIAGHVGGAIVGAGVSGLTFGIGGLLFGGLNLILEFTGSAGLQAIGVFTLLGSLPAVVVGGIALVGVPAVLGAWALAASATAKQGYAIDPSWRRPPTVAPPAPTARHDAPSLPLATLALPSS
ncbi:MAG: hypothetical protein IT383_08450 [Deltaproteobacteria bacterium]|nr:hypothetical protein [Deltaproteobacteria bacterium]